MTGSPPARILRAPAQLGIVANHPRQHPRHRQTVASDERGTSRGSASRKRSGSHSPASASTWSARARRPSTATGSAALQCRQQTAQVDDLLFLLHAGGNRRPSAFAAGRPPLPGSPPAPGTGASATWSIPAAAPPSAGPYRSSPPFRGTNSPAAKADRRRGTQVKVSARARRRRSRSRPRSRMRRAPRSTVSGAGAVPTSTAAGQRSDHVIESLIVFAAGLGLGLPRAAASAGTVHRQGGRGPGLADQPLRLLQPLPQGGDLLEATSGYRSSPHSPMPCRACPIS